MSERPPSLRSVLLPAALAGALIAGCGSTEEETPVACLGGAGGYVRALQAAPGEVLLGGETPISDCLTRNQTAGDLGKIGLAAVGAATRLNDGIRREPEPGPSAVGAGYLVGALRAGAERTDGIHAALIDRVTTAATNRRAGWGEPLDREFRRGVEAGEGGG